MVQDAYRECVERALFSFPRQTPASTDGHALDVHVAQRSDAQVRDSLPFSLIVAALLLCPTIWRSLRHLLIL